jgi:hypothetical protein
MRHSAPQVTQEERFDHCPLTNSLFLRLSTGRPKWHLSAICSISKADQNERSRSWQRHGNRLSISASPLNLTGAKPTPSAYVSDSDARRLVRRDGSSAIEELCATVAQTSAKPGDDARGNGGILPK